MKPSRLTFSGFLDFLTDSQHREFLTMHVTTGLQVKDLKNADIKQGRIKQKLVSRLRAKALCFQALWVLLPGRHTSRYKVSEYGSFDCPPLSCEQLLLTQHRLFCCSVFHLLGTQKYHAFSREPGVEFYNVFLPSQTADSFSILSLRQPHQDYSRILFPLLKKQLFL